MYLVGSKRTANTSLRGPVQVKNRMTNLRDSYTFRVTFSDEDNEYVGLCSEFPSLSWLAPTRDDACRGVEALVRGEGASDDLLRRRLMQFELTTEAQAAVV